MFTGGRLLVRPEFFLGSAGEKFDAEGNLTDADTKKHLSKFLDAFVAFATK